MGIITDVVRQFKQNWINELSAEAIEQACLDAGMKWNDSLLNPIVTVQLFFLQILHGNTACTHLPHLAGMAFTAAAYCKARMRIRLEVVQSLLSRSIKQLQLETFDSARWLGHRVFHVDGTGFSMPDTSALQAHFGQPGGQRKGCGFPVAHVLAMTHAGTGMITKILAAPLRTHDMAKTVAVHPELRENDLLVADRGFCSYAHLALLLQRGVHGLMRIHQRTIVDFAPGRPHAIPGRGKSQKQTGLPRSRWIRQLGVTDQIVAWLKPTTRPRWMSAEQYASLPDSITVRELRYEINRKGFRVRTVTLVTTLDRKSVV